MLSPDERTNGGFLTASQNQPYTVFIARIISSIPISSPKKNLASSISAWDRQIPIAVPALLLPLRLRRREPIRLCQEKDPHASRLLAYC
jgi:hypothetical protein